MKRFNQVAFFLALLGVYFQALSDQVTCQEIRAAIDIGSDTT